jgi:PDZ domain-containing protein
MIIKFINNNFKTKKDYIYFFLPIIFTIILLLPVPYYIDLSGGVINVDDNISVEDEFDISGNFYITYVSSVKGNVGFYLYSLISSYAESNYIDGESISKDKEANEFLQSFDLMESKENAKKVAYDKLGQDLKIENEKFYVTSISEEADTNLKLLDEFINVKEFDDLVENIKVSNLGDNVNFKVKRNDVKEDVYGKIISIDGEKRIGVYFSHFVEYENISNINYEFDDKLGGPSGGLMISLSLLNKLTLEDITKGYKIAGTGTISSDGEVGGIGGLKYKLKGASKAEVDYFLVPEDNYDLAKGIVDEEDYDFELLNVSTFDEAIEKLNKIK